MNDQRIEKIVSGILRAGVLASAVVTVTGGVVFLATHGSDPANYHVFRGQPDEHRLLGQIVIGALRGHSQPLMQFGILLLISTPVVRVAFSLVGFAMERDRTYVAVTGIVLSVLLYSLFK